MENEISAYKPLIDWLSYRSYEANRLRSPEVAYYRWRALYSDAIQFEEIFDNNFNRIQEGVCKCLAK